MKTKVLLISLFLSLALSSQAQSLTGKTWYCYLGTSSEGLKSSFAAQFEKKGTCEFLLIMTLPSSVTKQVMPSEYKNFDLTCTVEVHVDATYKMKGKDIIAYSFNKKKDVQASIDVELEGPGMSGEVKNKSENAVKNILYDSLDANLFIEALDDIMPEKGEFKINHLYDDSMELENDIDSYTFEVIDD